MPNNRLTFQKFLLILFCCWGCMGALFARGFSGDAPPQGDSSLPHWQKVDEGLYYGEFAASQKSEIGDSKITIVKIDPRYYDFMLLCASEHREGPRTIRQWARDFNLVAAVNAGMFQEDLLTSVGYMKNFTHLNNSRVSKENAFFVCNPAAGVSSYGGDSLAVDSILKPARIIDRTCEDFETLREQYHTIFQGIRMISCSQENTWSRQPGKWSMAVLGADKDDNILFIFTRSPYAVHDFVNILLALPIDIYNAMYLEGGPEAALYFSADDVEFEQYGRLDAGFSELDSISAAWPIPNVLGVVKKQQKTE